MELEPSDFERIGERDNPHGTGGFNLPQKDGFSSVINGL
jgi:hypothetical protein